VKRLDSSEIISEQLWIGSAPNKEDLVQLKKEIGPKLVVVDLTRSPDEEAECRKEGIRYDDRTSRIEDDYTPIPIPRLKLVARIIDDNISSGRRVFLHCKAGLGRSPTCAAAYLVHCGTSLTEAREMVTSKREVWKGRDADYAGLLAEFAKMQEISRVENPSFM
jgi:protein-tyrosine phosphatase